jgi:16S rRNA (guanine966-N2)-methyltransferase
MRVVAGSARGRSLQAPPGSDTRPTADRVREAIFNALHSLDLVVDATVVDLFAGSGALGIEALSRGARQCTFVEANWTAMAAIHTNLAATGLASRATVTAGRAETWMLANQQHFDLALADPPYAYDDWAELLASVPADVLVAESDRVIDPSLLPLLSPPIDHAERPSWEVMRERQYGTTVVNFLRRVT